MKDESLVMMVRMVDGGGCGSLSVEGAGWRAEGGGWRMQLGR